MIVTEIPFVKRVNKNATLVQFVDLSLDKLFRKLLLKDINNNFFERTCKMQLAMYLRR